MYALRLRSSYSLLQGTASPQALCQRIQALGYQGLAMTDRDNLYGLWPLLREAKNLGLTVVVGAEISEQGSTKLVTCLVRDELGYRLLCQLLSRRHQDPEFTLIDHLPAFATGLVLLCRDETLLRHYHGLGLAVRADLGARPSAWGRQLRRLATELGVAAVFTADADLIDRDDLVVHRLLQAVRLGAAISEVMDSRTASPVHCLEEKDEYRERFAVWPEVLGATEELARECHYAGPRFGIVMPPWRHAEGRGAEAVLRDKAYAGARSRYGDDLGEPVVERLEHELRVIAQMGYSSYFLVVRDIVHRRGTDGVRRKRRICGRGSGAASLVAYCLDITNVCPIRYNLYFERFLNPGRTDPPDIDIDFSWDERDEVLADVFADFGERAAMVCNHVCFQPRMAIRETAKAYGLPGSEISALTRRIPWLGSGSKGPLVEQLAQLPAFRGQDLSPPWPEILTLAERLIGLPRCLSVHPGGVVITPEPVNHYVPVEWAPKGVPIIQWEKDGAEEAGLVKIDLLGNRSLGVIRDCLAAVKKSGETIDEGSWLPEEDPGTRLLVAEGGTMGCFYIESPAMRLLEQKAGSGDFEQLVIQSSIIRPAANEFVREYVRRLHGGAWQPLCPQLGSLLDETYGLMVYQEDVSRVAVALAGFSHSDGDGLRKIMSKKDKARRLENYREMFFSGSLAKGLEQETVEGIWQMMLSFDGYSFCKPHSASYARVSFQAAYLKRHFPAQFMAAVISNQGGYYSTFAYLSEARRLGLIIQSPDVECSQRSWSGKGQWLRVGLQAVSGLSANFLSRLFAARDERRFSSLEDFFQRTKPADDEVRALVHAGALDGLGQEMARTRMLWQWARYQRADQLQAGAGLFAVRLPPPPDLAEADSRTLARREFAVLGFLCGQHPLDFYAVDRRKVAQVNELPGKVGRRVQLAVWLLTGKLVSTRTGEVMEFLTFEDATGVVETTFFPGVYRAYANVLRSNRAYLLTGIVEEDYGALTLTVEKVAQLRPQ